MRMNLFMNNYMKNSQGFTLIEVLLSIVILSIIIVPLFNFFAQSLYHTKSNQQHTIATYAARNALVFVEKQGFEGFCAELNCDPENISDIDYDLIIEIDYDYCKDNYALFGIDELSDAEQVCSSFFSPTFNNIQYEIIGTIGLHGEYSKYLLPVEIQAKWRDIKKDNTTKLLRGFISHEDIRYQPVE